MLQPSLLVGFGLGYSTLRLLDARAVANTVVLMTLAFTLLFRSGGELTVRARAGQGDADGLSVLVVPIGRLPSAALDALVSKGQVKGFAKGDVVYQRGDPGDSLLFTITGRIKLANTNMGGKEIVLHYVGEGELFGEIVALDGKEPRGRCYRHGRVSNLFRLHA